MGITKMRTRNPANRFTTCIAIKKVVGVLLSVIDLRDRKPITRSIGIISAMLATMDNTMTSRNMTKILPRVPLLSRLLRLIEGHAF